MKQILMVIVHLVSILFAPILLVLTIPLHLIILKMGATNDIGENDFVGPRNLSNINYRDYLTRKYEIKKNDILNIYSFNGKSFQNLDDLLKALAIHDGGKVD